MNRTPPDAGQLPRWFGRHLLLKQLSFGGFGTVYFAVHAEQPKRLCVVKTLRADLLEDEEAHHRFAHEAKISVFVDSPHFARVYEVGIVGPIPYLALEYVPGMRLSQTLVRLQKTLRPWSYQTTAQLALDIAESVSALHETKGPDGSELGIIHCDLSPTNMIAGPKLKVRLIDLGIGKSVLREFKTRVGAIVGSPGYLSPEQVLSIPMDQRSDQFAVAVVIWELFAVRRLIPAGPLGALLEQTLKLRYPPLRQIRPSIPAELDQVLERALSLQRDLRFSTTRELRDQLFQVFSSRQAVGEGQDCTTFEAVYAPEHDAQALASLLELADEIRAPPTEEPTVLAAIQASVERERELTPSELTPGGSTSWPSPQGDQSMTERSFVRSIAKRGQLLVQWSRRDERRWLAALIALTGLVCLVLGLWIRTELLARSDLSTNTKGDPRPFQEPRSVVMAEPHAVSAEPSASGQDPTAANTEEKTGPDRPTPLVRSRAASPAGDVAPSETEEGEAIEPPEPKELEPAPASHGELLHKALELEASDPELRPQLSRILSDLALEARRHDPVRLRGIQLELDALTPRPIPAAPDE